REARARQRPAQLRELAPVNAVEARVEPAPARDAVDVLRRARPRQLSELRPVELQLVLHFAEDAERPGREVGLRHPAGVEDGPLLGQVLAGRKACRVEAGGPNLALGHRAEHLAYTSRMAVAAKAYARPRAYVRVKGPEAADFLQRMLSNDVLASPVCEALLLTPKARVIAPLVVWRRGEDDFLLLTEPELGETVRAHLTRMRIATR